MAVGNLNYIQRKLSKVDTKSIYPICYMYIYMNFIQIDLVIPPKISGVHK